MDPLPGPAGSKPKLIIPPSVKEVNVRLARPDERRRWDATMAEQHPLGFRGFAGRGLRYVAEYQGCWLALIGWQSGAFKCRPRDLWIGWRQREQFPRLHLIANNTRMLMLCPPGTIPNLASCVMAANLRRLSCDWPSSCTRSLHWSMVCISGGALCSVPGARSGTRCGSPSGCSSPQDELRTLDAGTKSWRA